MSLLTNFERYPLTFGPTPIEHLPRLSEALGGKVQIYAKRDDCNSGLAMGGNKLRKLEYIVPDAIASGADTLVSIGGVRDGARREGTLVAEDYGSTAQALRRAHMDASLKLIENLRAEGRGPELYDLDADPSETANLAESNEAARTRMEAELADALRRLAAESERMGAERAAIATDPDVAAALEALGYVVR